MLSISRKSLGKLGSSASLVIFVLVVIAIVPATQMDIDVTKQVSWISIIYIHRLHLFIHIISVVLVSTTVKNGYL
jgi:hypothetical protein